MDHDAHLLSLARAISERLPVDWAGVESSVGGADERGAVRELRVIAQIAALHRAGAASDSGMWGALRLVEHVGRGSYGDVYRAVDTRLDRDVALKLLRHPEAVVDTLGTTAIEEARLLARVRHPNVVTIHGADRFDGRVGLWMEFVRGRTLDQIVRERGPLPAAEVVSIGLDIVRALAAVHAAGLLHRDIKAQNVMQDDTGRVVLMDFGAGRDVAAEGAGDVAGTPLYLAPEVLGGQPATVQSDVYSVGVLLFHLATGRYPVVGRTVAEIRAAHAAGHRTPLRTLRPDVSPLWAALIERSLAAAPSDRFATATAMENAAVQATDGGLAGRAAPGRRLAMAAVTGIIALIGGLAGLAWYGPRVATPAEGDRAVWKGLDVDLFGTVSDDGRYVSFIEWNVTNNLMLRDLRAGTNRPLTPNRTRDEFGFADYSVMSRDGARVVYSWQPTGAPQEELRLMTLVNGGPGPDRVIWRGTPDEGLQPFEWSPDEAWLLVRRIRRQAGERDIGTLDVATGELRVIKTFARDLRADDMALSPDGRYIAYDRGEIRQPQGIYILRVADGRETQVVAWPGNNTVMGWSRGGHLLFASDRGGKLGLWALAMENGAPAGAAVHVKQDIGSSWALGLTSSDTLYVWKRSGALSFRIAPFAADRSAIDESAPQYVEHFIESRGRHDWSADGRFVTFVDCGRTGGGGCTITMRDTWSGEVWSVPHRMGYVWFPRLSPDGRHIATHGNVPREGANIYLIETRTGVTSSVVGGVPFQQFSLEWSADGKRLYFVRGGATEPLRLVERELASGTEREVFSTSLPMVREIRLSPDGRLVAFRTGADGRHAVMVAPVAGGEPRSVMSSASLIDWRIEWTPDSRALLVKKGPVPNVVEELWLAPVDGSPRKLNIDTSRWDGDGAMQMDPTGRYLSYVASAGDPGAEVWALENFLPRPPTR